jgi:hypothetical protein
MTAAEPTRAASAAARYAAFSSSVATPPTPATSPVTNLAAPVAVELVHEGAGPAPEPRRDRLALRMAVVLAVALFVAASVFFGVTLTHHSQPPVPAAAPLTGPVGPEGVVLEEGTQLAGLNITAVGQPIDGVQCGAESLAYHVHAHLTIYVNGVLRPVPAGVGLVGPVDETDASQPAFDAAAICYYVLHTHAQDGVIHIESPTETLYSLGQFFGLWGVPLTGSQVGSANGKVTAFVNGKRFSGDPSRIPLTSHADIQLDVGTVVGPKTIDWSATQL